MRPEYTDRRLAAGIIPICTKTGNILLCKRNAEGSYPNHWGLFGGTFEEVDVYPKETAKREFKEETKYCGTYDLSSSPIDTMSNNFITFYTYVGLFNEEFVPDVDGEDEFSQENVDYGWFPIDRLPDNMIPDLKRAIDENKKLLDNIILSYGKFE